MLCAKEKLAIPMASHKKPSKCTIAAIKSVVPADTMLSRLSALMNPTWTKELQAQTSLIQNTPNFLPTFHQQWQEGKPHSPQQILHPRTLSGSTVGCPLLWCPGRQAMTCHRKQHRRMSSAEDSDSNDNELPDCRPQWKSNDGINTLVPACPLFSRHSRNSSQF